MEMEHCTRHIAFLDHEADIDFRRSLRNHPNVYLCRGNSLENTGRNARLTVNILAYHAFLAKGEGLFSPMILIIVALALYLLWAGRKGFLGLLNCARSENNPRAMS